MTNNSAGTLTIAIGVLHQAVGAVFGRDLIAAIARDGVIGAVEPSFERGMLFWFLFFGFVLILFGASLRAHEHAGHVPRSLGYGLFALALAGGLAIPVSGLWLVLVPAVLIIVRGAPPTVPEAVGRV